MTTPAGSGFTPPRTTSTRAEKKSVNPCENPQPTARRAGLPTSARSPDDKSITARTREELKATGRRTFSITSTELFVAINPQAPGNPSMRLGDLHLDPNTRLGDVPLLQKVLAEARSLASPRAGEDPGIPMERLGQLLDLVFRPTAHFHKQLRLPLFDVVLGTLQGPDTPEEQVHAVLDRLFDPRAKWSREDHLGAALEALVHTLGGQDMGNWHRLAILERGIESMDWPPAAGTAQQRAQWWLAPLLQQPGTLAGLKQGLRFVFDYVATSHAERFSARTQALFEAAFEAVADEVNHPQRLFTRLLATSLHPAPGATMALALDAVEAVLHAPVAGPGTCAEKDLRDAFARSYAAALGFSSPLARKAMRQFAKIYLRPSTPSAGPLVNTALRSLARWPVVSLEHHREMWAGMLESARPLGAENLRQVLAAQLPGDSLDRARLQMQVELMFKELGGDAMSSAQLGEALAEVARFRREHPHAHGVGAPLARGIVTALGGSDIASDALAKVTATLMEGMPIWEKARVLTALCECLQQPIPAPQRAVLAAEVASKAHDHGLDREILACALAMKTDMDAKSTELARQPLQVLAMRHLNACDITDALIALCPLSPVPTPESLTQDLERLLREGPRQHRDLRVTAVLDHCQASVTADMVRRAREGLLREHSKSQAIFAGLDRKTSEKVGSPGTPALQPIYKAYLDKPLTPAQRQAFIDAELAALAASPQAQALAETIAWLRARRNEA